MKRRILKWLRVAERPSPPPGAGESFEVFNPSKKLLLLHWLEWGWKQFWAFFGVLASLAFLGSFQLPGAMSRFREVADEVKEEMELEKTLSFDIFGINIDTDFPIIELITIFEVFAIGIFLIQFVISAILVKLRWEMHWYMVSDRILGIRKGLWKINEQTMTIANVQNMNIKQGPVQRLLGISDLVVQTAGGSGNSAEAAAKGKQLHLGRFEGLDNAEGLRETIRTTLARSRSAGLGDPDDEADEVHEFEGADTQTLASATESETGRSASDGQAQVGASLVAEASAFRQEARRARIAAESLLEGL